MGWPTPLLHTSSSTIILGWTVLMGCTHHRTSPPPTTTTAEAAAHTPHSPHHFSDPARFVAQWNDSSRDVWQKPDEIIALLEVPPGGTVVDLGSGTGYLVPFLSRAVGADGRVLAQDISPDMVRYLQGAVETAGWSNVTVLQGAAQAPGLPPGEVDRLVTINVWHHIDDRPAFAAKLYEALRPQGMVLIVDFLPEPTEGFGPPLEMRLSAAQIQADLEAGGFRTEVVAETLPRHFIVRGTRP